MKNTRIAFLIVAILFLIFLGINPSRADSGLGFISGIAGRGGKTVKTSTAVSYKLLETYPACTITVYQGGTTTIATIYSNSSGTLKANPFFSDSTAAYSFFVAPGNYDIKFSGVGVSIPYAESKLSINTNIASAATDVINIRNAPYNAICDGNSHPLSSIYNSLSAAQVTYPFITSLTQQVDYAAIKKGSNDAFGPDLEIGPSITCPACPNYLPVDKTSTTSQIIDLGANYPVNIFVGKRLFLRFFNGFIESSYILSNTATTITLETPVDDYHCGGETCLTICGSPPQTFDCIAYAIGVGEHSILKANLNKPLYIPAGNCYLGSNTWTIKDAVGINIYGVGMGSSTITSNSAVFRTDGLWTSNIEKITWKCNNPIATGCFDIDGNVPGHAYATRSVQGNVYKQNQIVAANSTYGFISNRQGGSSAQGESLYEENRFENCLTCLYINGFNNLANKVIRGDFQNFLTGISLVAGSINVDTTSFESTRLYDQVTSGGFDIHTGEAGVTDSIVITGVRTESAQFFKGSSTQPAVLIGNRQYYGAVTNWSPNSSYTLHAILTKNVVSSGSTLIGRLFYVSVAGTSGGVEPVWPATGTIVDGTITWTEITPKIIDTTSISGFSAPGTISGFGNIFSGPVSIGGWSDPQTVGINASFTAAIGNISVQTTTFLVNSTTSSRVVTLPPAAINTIFIFKKIDSSANTVTITPSGTTIDNSGSSIVIPGGSLGYVTLQYSGENNIGASWWILNKSF